MLACLGGETGEYLLGAYVKYFEGACLSLCVCIDCVLVDVPVRGISFLGSLELEERNNTTWKDW